jgi:hypothetical protein
MRFDGLVKRGLEGLSIVILQAFSPCRYIVKAICRQIDKPHSLHSLHITQTKVCQGLKYAAVYKGYPNTPIDIQTISPGYKRFEGLADMKVWQYMRK